MNLKNFKSGVYVKQHGYKSFCPEKINHTWVWNDAKINVLLEQATRSLGELNAFSFIVPDIDIFIQMHIFKEAQSSSKIEGTKTEIDEALMDKEDISPEKRDDWQEVQNYVKAMNHGIESQSYREITRKVYILVSESHPQPFEHFGRKNCSVKNVYFSILVHRNDFILQ